MIEAGDLLITDENWEGHLEPIVAGERVSRGLIPRDYSANPQGCYAAAPSFDLQLIPRSEWADRIREMEANKARVSDVRRTAGPDGGLIPSLDQNGKGYCWAHSATMAVMLTRALMNEPYVRLSAFMVACIIKNYKDEGGWGALALDFIGENGIPSVQFWPEKSMSRSNDNPAMRANAQQHRVSMQWADLSAPVYDRNLTEDQAMTLLLQLVPLVGDFNWWGHSVCIMDPVLITKNANSLDVGSLDMNDAKDAKVYGDNFGKRIINSWTDSYGNQGEAVLSGSKAHLDGGVAPRIVQPSPV